MITLHSIDLKHTNEKCFAEGKDGRCRILVAKQRTCRTYQCPFYKPKGCRDWVRVEGKKRVELVPPEEYAFAVRRRHEQRTSLCK